MLARAARAEDLDDILRLAALAGPGFTSLAVGEEKLSRRLSKSITSFAGPAALSPDHYYMLILEADGEVIGMSAVKAQIGIRDPFFNFRILNVAQKSNAADKRFDMDVLALVNDYSGASEVGSLFVTEGQRGSGAGRLISQARYMLAAAEPQRFAERVISELRGHVSDSGVSPFWEAIGRKFFHMDFLQADFISAEQDNQFILDLMPKYPIYTALLPPEAQAVIGQTHPAGAGARRMLEAEGFRYDGMIDIFDGGPSMSAPRDDIRTVRDSRLLKIKAVNEDLESGGPLTALVSNNKIKNFCCVLSAISFTEHDINLPPSTLSALELRTGDTARIWIKR